jgi:hypothetical protein
VDELHLLAEGGVHGLVPLQAAHGWFAIHATLHGYGHDRLGVLSTCQPVERRM